MLRIKSFKENIIEITIGEVVGNDKQISSNAEEKFSKKQIN